MTLLAAWWGLQDAFYRRFFVELSRGKGRTSAPEGIRSLYGDYGIDLTTWQSLTIGFADLDAPVVLMAILVILSVCLAIGLMGRPSEEQVERRTSRSLRWAVRGAVASVVIGVVLVLMALAYIRLMAFHPHPLPTVALLIGQGLAAAVGVVCGVWCVIRGPRRLVAGACAVVSLVPLIWWGYVGMYAYDNWRQRFVPNDLPNDLPMNLAKMLAMPLMRLEASVEYPQRLESDRIVMFYDVLNRPRNDLEAMERHVARMEGMLGKPLRSKVFWIRGRLRRLDLGDLSIHGIALGSNSSLDDWKFEGNLDRHELAHATLDQYRDASSDPPYFFHEGWADSQSGVSSSTLAQRALNLRGQTPKLGIRDMVSPSWYHTDSGPVYAFGGAFVDHVIRVHGVDAFLRLYQKSRPETFEATCREVLGADLDTVEARFWEDTRREAAKLP